MQKVIFLGTDLHNEPTEMASKLVRDLSKKFIDPLVVSIQHRKKTCSTKNCLVVPRFFLGGFSRKLLQGILLPFFLLILRFRANKIISFWVGRSLYHHILFWFMNLLRYEIIFTIISGEDRNYSSLRFCKKIICQSEKMESIIKKRFPQKEIYLIRPWVNLKQFYPSKKVIDVVVPSVPYDKKDFSDRGIPMVIESLKKGNLSSVIILRSDKSYQIISNEKVPRAKLIHKSLSDKELSEILSGSRVMPLIYGKNSPDSPLSALEGFASGCLVICTKNMGISEIVLREGGCGWVLENTQDLPRVLKELINNGARGNTARKVAEKYFDKEKNIKKYLEVISHGQKGCC